MGKIRLENIQLYAYHGCLEEEGKIGSDYKVELEVKSDLSIPSKSDKLADTVDYTHLNKIVKEEMAIRSKLLEHVAKRILNRLYRELPNIDSARVWVSKIAPPINGGSVEKVTVQMSSVFHRAQKKK